MEKYRVKKPVHMLRKVFIVLGSSVVSSAAVHRIAPNVTNPFVKLALWAVTAGVTMKVADWAISGFDQQFDPILDAIEEGTLGDMFLIT